MRIRIPSASDELARLQVGACGMLLLALALAAFAPQLYWTLLGALVAACTGFLLARCTVVFCVAWLLITGMTIEMALNDLIGPQAFQPAIAVVKGSGLVLALICVWRYGPRLDMLNPAWGFVAMGATGAIHGLYPGLTAADSLRSLAGSVAPFAFSFSRLSPAWAQAIIRATIWCPVVAVAAGAVLAATDIRPLFVDSGGARLGGVGHPAFLAGVCLPAIYAGLIELWRDGRPRDGVLLAVNLLILVLTGARAPLAYALAVSGLTLLSVPSPMVPPRQRLVVVLVLGVLLPPLVVMASDLEAVRLFNVLSNNMSDLSGREYLWPAFETAATESPWFGWGLGAGNVIIPPESEIAQMLHTRAAHNEYLRIAVDGGSVGRALLVVLFVLWVWRNTARLCMTDRRIMRLVFLAFAAHAITDNVLISTPACVLFAFTAAVFTRTGPSCLPGSTPVA